MAKKQFPKQLFVPEGCTSTKYIDGGSVEIKTLVDDFSVDDGDEVGVYKLVEVRKVKFTTELV